MNKVWLLILLFLSFMSCKDNEVVTGADEEIQEYLDAANLAATRTDNGIYYYAEVNDPDGASFSSGNVLAIYYNLFDLEDNLVASHQRSNGDSLIFKQGVAACYPIGLDASIGAMRLGETYSFLLPPEQSFGQVTDGSLNPNRVYRIQVQLVGIFSEENLFSEELVAIEDYVAANDLNNTTTHPLDPVQHLNSGLSFKRLSAGDGAVPASGDSIFVSYQGSFLDGSGNFDSKNEFAWVYGSDEPRELIPGFEEGVSLMQTNEEALLLMPSSIGYRESALVIPAFATANLIENAVVPDYVAKVPPYKTLIFNITRLD